MNMLKKIKGILPLIILLTFTTATGVILSSCSHQPQTVNETKAPPWNDNLKLSFKGRNYTVTSKTTNDIGSTIGTISYHGNGSVYKIYSIKHIKDYKKIAVKTRNGYRVAIIDNAQ